MLCRLTTRIADRRRRCVVNDSRHPGAQVTSKALIARAFSQQLIFRATGMAATIATVTVTTRYLGPSSYGTLTTALVFVGLWTSLTELGTGSVIVRLVNSSNGSLERLVRTNVGVSIVYAIPLFAIATFSGYLVYRSNTEITQMIVIISVSLILTALSSCFQPVFAATLRFGAVAAGDLFSKLASLALTVILVSQQAGLLWFALVQLVPPLLVLLVQGFAAFQIVDCRPTFSWRESRALLVISFPQTVVLTIGFLYFRVDGVILSLVSSADEVGMYGLAYALAYSVSVIPIFFSSSTLSAMTHLHSASVARFGEFISRCTEAMLFLGVPIAIIGVTFARPIVEAIGSSEYVDRGAPTFALLISAAAIAFVAGVTTQALFSAHDQKVLMQIEAVVLLCNIALNVALAPRFGALAAGIVMVSTECLKLVLSVWRLRTITSYRLPRRFALRLLLPVAITTATAIFLVRYNAFISIPVVCAVYLMSNLLAGPMTLREVRSLRLDHAATGEPGPTDERLR